jgi:ectoine hydroxylase-related dioxygenase (phytanoyl-CoA dioxygenase family)
MPDTVVVRHEQNHHFHWRSRPGPYELLSEDQARAYDTLGYLVVEDAFDADTLREVIAEIDPFEAEVEAALRALEGRKAFIARADEITFTTHLVTKSERLRRFVATGTLRALCHDLIGDDVRLYWDQAVYKKPGTDASFPWHQDNGYAFVEPQQYLTCWIALTDATRDNGCPWVVPGLHRIGTLAHRLTDTGFVCLDNPPDAVPVPVRAGSIVVFSSLTPHCTGPNRTEQVRKAYIVQYAPDGAAVEVPDADGAIQRYPADDARRQFPVLRDGRAVTPDVTPSR